MPTSMFTWGYHGWGNATPQLVGVVDSVERGRGFGPPMFVDIRIRRTVRAKGFQGNAFEKLLGLDRHRWMKSLGNKFIETRSGPSIQIADPAAAQELLDLAVNLADRGQRLLFFCSCPLPRHEGKTACHRDTVAGLVLKAAKKTGVEVEVIEWPGGEPDHAEIDVSPATFKALERGRVTVPLDDKPASTNHRCLPWGSIVTVRAGEQEMRVVTGPASWQHGQWLLPVFWFFYDPDTDLSEIERKAMKLRRSWGLEARSAG
jgi:hypothetical protein